MAKQQTIFYPGLNDFCRKYLVQNTPITPMDRQLFSQRLADQQKALFEQFLLFETLSFKVHGENILLPMLQNLFGKKGFDALIEQGSIKFVLWTPTILQMVDEIKGVNALSFGNLSSEPHTDPEKSIELGMNWAREKPSRKELSRLVEKVTPLYSLPRKEISGEAVELTNSAFLSGKLKRLGFDPEIMQLTELPLAKRKLLSKCADEVLEYSFLHENGMTSFSNFNYFWLFNESAKKLSTLAQVGGAYSQAATLEDLPDLKAMYDTIRSPLQSVPRFRGKRSSVKFRQWLAGASAGESGKSISKEYMDAIAEPKGFFQSKTGKTVKSIAMTAIGTGVAAAIESRLDGAVIAAGVAAAKIIEPIADLGLDLLDQFVLDGLIKGWTPRMFFEDMEQWSAESKVG
ncbi:hypothetical protein PQR39_21130 [Paraburkholderia sediminicola]|uniref:hypothetical protein n=1 Tax=Paraburkholderia sediminicola TaxID=458836 RepID=UPI0038B8BD7B